MSMLPMDERQRREVQRGAEKEQEAISAFLNFIDENAELLKHVSSWGDGRCGYLSLLMQERLCGPGCATEEKGHRKARISSGIRTAVFERDLYRCKHCGTHLDLTVDHITPESQGGDLSMSNLQTLCRTCNSVKGVS